jgi:putative effector of murein hydrolase
LAYFIAAQIHRKWTNPATTPLLLAVLMVIIFLKVTGISYGDYYIGGSYLNTLIVPSTVALGIPLFQAFKLMKFHARSIISGVMIGAIVNTTLTALAKTFGMNFSLRLAFFLNLSLPPWPSALPVKWGWRRLPWLSLWRLVF